jgi:hypothetical protein
MALQSVRHANQYMLKPCGAEELKATVDRTVNLKDVFLNEAVKTVVAKIDTLPSLPRAYLELMAELRRECAVAIGSSAIWSTRRVIPPTSQNSTNPAFIGLRTHGTTPSPP